MSAYGIGGAGAPGGDTLAALKEGRIEGREKRLRAATRLLEGVFYQELFKAMRETVPQGGVVSGGTGQEMFESLLDEHVADAAAMRSEGGLGSVLYRYFVGSAGGDRDP